MSQDLNDAVNNGVSLTDLLKAAKGADPILGTEWVDLVDAGCARLDQLATLVEGCQEAREAKASIIYLIQDQVAMRAIGVAEHRAPERTRGPLARLELGPRGVSTLIRDLKRAMRKEAKWCADETAAQEEEYELSSLGSLLRGVKEAPRGLVCPPKYKISEAGIEFEGRGIADEPMVVIGCLYNQDTEEYSSRIAFRRRGRWKVLVVPRDTLTNYKKLLDLSAKGAPVDSLTSKFMVPFLTAFEAVNSERLKDEVVSERMGWHGKSFLSGPGRLSLSEGGAPISVIDHSGILAGYRTAGTWEGWTDCVSRYIAPRPLALAAVLVAATAPLLKVLSIPGFVADWSGETSGGKTSAIRVGASVWGVPDESDTEGIILSWQTASAVAPALLAYQLQNMPLIMDDTKNARSKAIVERLVYMIPNGSESMAATRDRTIRRVKKWRTVLMMSGESPATSFSQNAGAHARVLSIQGAPFGDRNDANAEAAEESSAELLEHYGHMGPRLATWLVDHPQEHAGLRARYADLKAHYGEGAHGPARRLAGYVAAVQVAGECCIDLGLPVTGEQMLSSIDGLRDAAEAAGRSSDRPLHALRMIVAWCHGHRSRLKRPDENTPPAMGWVGTWDYRDQNWSDICIYPHDLRAILEREKFDASGIIAAWAERKWISGTGAVRRDSTRVHVIARWAIDSAIG